MRKFLPQISFVTIFTLAIGFFAMPYLAHAQAAADSSTSFTTALSKLVDFLTGGFNFFYGFIGGLFWYILIPIAGKVFWLLGQIIDIALNMSLDSSFYSSDAIGTAWGIMRDIANMFFIFVLIYEGIKTILNLGNLVTVRKTITSVVIAALFLNFSLFFTKVVIDVSNVGATWFMQGIKNIGGDPSSVSNSIGSTLGMEKLVSKFQATSPTDYNKIGTQSYMTGILVFVLTCVAIYVFFNFLFLIMGRIVSFIFLMITAPIGFVGPLIPMLQDYSKKWWSELNNQAMMLPMFFLLVYITLFIVDRIQSLLLSSASDPTAFTPPNYVIFIIIIMMLLKALKVAEEYSGEIGKMVGGLAKNATTFVAGVGFAGTVGRAASALRSSTAVQDFAQKNQFAGRLALSGLNSVATAGLGAGSAYKGALKTTGLDKTGLKDTFKSADKGHEGVTKDEIEAEKERMKLVKDAERKLSRVKYLQSGGTGLMGLALKGAAKMNIPYAADAAAGLRKAGGFVRAGEELKKDKDIAKAQRDENAKEETKLMAEKAELEKKIKDANDAWGAARTGGDNDEMEKQHNIEEKAKADLEKHNKKIAAFKEKKEKDDKTFAEAEEKKRLTSLAEALKENAPAEEKPAKEESAPKEEKK